MQVDFEQTRQMLQHRPWAIDNLNDLVEDWTCQSPRKTIMFVDNSGSDVVLGEFIMTIQVKRIMVSHDCMGPGKWMHAHVGMLPYPFAR